MKMFTFKAILIAAAMFLSVLFGMQQANEGIHKMKGYEDELFKAAFTITEQEENGELQASVLGNDVSSHDLEKKKEQLEEIKGYNFFSSLGKSLADSMTAIVGKIIESITDKQ